MSYIANFIRPIIALCVRIKASTRCSSNLRVKNPIYPNIACAQSELVPLSLAHVFRHSTAEDMYACVYTYVMILHPHMFVHACECMQCLAWKRGSDLFFWRLTIAIASTYLFGKHYINMFRICRIYLRHRKRSVEYPFMHLG